jgi:hypothetical protein
MGINILPAACLYSKSGDMAVFFPALSSFFHCMLASFCLHLQYS